MRGGDRECEREVETEREREQKGTKKKKDRFPSMGLSGSSMN